MCDGFNHGALQIAVAQICQSMGWDALQKSTHDLLTDVLQKYLEEIAKSAHGYCQLYSRTEPNLDDLNQAFQDIGVCLRELEDFVSQVDQVPFIHQLPRFPKPKPCALHHPRNGEIEERLEQYFDYLPPLVSKLLQSEDEEKAATEDTDTTDAGKEGEAPGGFVRNEIKTVAEETSNVPVAVKRPLDNPPGLENEAKKRRLDLPFMQKGNRGNEMDILEALQGNLSSPSPTPSPDVWSTAKTFDMPSTSGSAHIKAAHTTEKPGPSNLTTDKPKVEKKKAVQDKKPPGKPAEAKPKSSPKKKVKVPKNAASSVTKAASPTVNTPRQPQKEKSPSVVKSPLSDKKPSTPETKAKAKAKPVKENKNKKPSVKAKKPTLKSPPLNTEPVLSKENIQSKESMPKLIIKPLKQEANKEPHFTVSEFLPTDNISQQEKPKQKKPKNNDSTSKKQKPKADKKGTIPSIKVEAKELSIPSTSEEVKFSIGEFAVMPAPVESNLSGELPMDMAVEHKKKKKKRKEKDKDKEKKKDKSKKLKTDHGGLSQAPLPRITVKLEPPSHSASSTLTSKLEPAAPVSLGTASSQVTGNVGPVSPKVTVKQESSVSSAIPKLTIKSDPLERTVVSQTVSTYVVHGDGRVYYCPVCSDPDDGSFMIGCDGCDEWFHGRCVGIEEDPEPGTDWYCSSCLDRKGKDSKDKQKKKKKKKNKEKEK